MAFFGPDTTRLPSRWERLKDLALGRQVALSGLSGFLQGLGHKPTTLELYFRTERGLSMAKGCLWAYDSRNGTTIVGVKSFNIKDVLYARIVVPQSLVTPLVYHRGARGRI